METNCFIDDRTLVLGQTLIRLRSGEAHVTVPSSFGGYTVSAIGRGALTLDGTREVTIAPGFTELKGQCVSATSSLKRVNIPESVRTVPETLFTGSPFGADGSLYVDRALSPALFAFLRRLALSTGGTDLMLPSVLLDRAELEPVRGLIHSVGGPAAWIAPEMRVLFNGRQTDGANGVYTGTVFDPRPCYDYRSGRKETEEYTAVMEMIGEGDPGWHQPDAERESDRMLRAGHSTPGRDWGRVGTAVCGQLPGSPGPDGLFHVVFQLSQKTLFFPALRYVRHRGGDWWIYSRNWLTVTPECPYRREDVGVFDRSGLVTGRRASEDVYAKARVLSLL